MAFHQHSKFLENIVKLQLLQNIYYSKRKDHYTNTKQKEKEPLIKQLSFKGKTDRKLKIPQNRSPLTMILPSLTKYLESKLRNCKTKGEEINNDIILRHDDFQEEMFIRRLIGGFLMSIIIIFFFYYSVVFCEVYLNTQRNLVFSWVWSLFWEWVIFAPIYIVVISVLENKKSNSKDPVVYYLKRLFFF